MLKNIEKTNLNSPIIIITNNIENVNIDTESTIKRTFSKNEKWKEKKMKSLLISQKLQAIGETRRAERMKNCGDVLEYSLCKECGEYHIKKANLCRDRFCPACSWRLSLQRYSEMKRLLMNIENAYPEITDWSLITLTVKNCYIDDLNEIMQKMSRAWNLAISQRSVRPVLFGWARSVEVTFNEDTRELHPHYHILIGWWENRSEDLIRRWMNACSKYGLIANIKAQNAQKITYYKAENGNIKTDTDLPENFTKAVLETFKYSVKGSDLEKMKVSEFREIVNQYSNKRLVAYGGKIKEYAKLLKIETDKVQDEEYIKICKNCGAPELEQLIYKWSFGTNAYELQ